MRVVALAIVVGVALGFALLGAFVDETRPLVSSLVSPTVNDDYVPRPIQRSAVNDELLDSVGPASHGDSNTDSDEREPELNSNVIAGQPTTVCTSDSRLGSALTTAVQRWNGALSKIGTVFTIVAATPASGPGVDVTASVCGRVNVELVWRSSGTRCDNDFADRTRACLLDKGTTNPPRLGFRNVKSALNLRDRSVIVYQVPSHRPVNVGTLVHELGHALGLRHYDDDTACRDLHDPTIDPLADQFTAMTYPDAETASGVRCDARGVVTGRDLRDFYEAYRVGAITDVRLDGSATESGTGTTKPLSFTLWWGADGIAEANHNASHIAVLRQASGLTSWTQVGTAILIRDNNNQPMMYVDIYDELGVAALYKVVGLTRGDIQRQGDFDVTKPFQIPGPTRGTTITARFTEGDPTYVKGVAAYTENGTQIEVSGPNVLSASVSPRYCYVNNSLAVSMHSSGGSSTATESITDTAGGDAEDSASVPCGTVTGQRSFTAKAAWGSGASEIPRTISLPINVHPRPVRVNSVSATIQVPNPTMIAGTPAVSSTVTSCAKGEQVTLSVSTGSPRPMIERWVNGAKLPSSTFSCPDVMGPIQILALRPDGGGRQLSLDITDPLKVAFSSGRTATARKCSVGSNGGTNFFITGGTMPYTATLGGRDISAKDLGKRYNPTRTLEFPCPSAGTTLRVSVTDAVGRTASATVPLNIESAPTPPVTPPPTPPVTPPPTPPVTPPPTPPVTPPATDPPAPTNVSASTSVTATAATATLTWTAPAGASNVSYKLWRSEATSNSSTTSTTYTFENLNPYQTYNLYVWTVDAAGVESAKVVTQVTMPGRPGVPRTAAPTGLQASNITTSSATLSWNAVPGATGYRVWRSSGQMVRLPTTARSYTFAGLLPSRKYSLTVWAVGDRGLSPTARVVIHTQGPTLATPTGLRATTSVTATAATATLTWSAVSGAASYGLWRSDGQNVTTTGTSYTFTRLIPHKRYNLYVWAVDSAGHGSAHARVSVTLPGRPGVAQTAAPTGVQASGITASSATLSWNGVAGATGYEVWRSGGQSVDLAATARSYTFTGLTGERRYSLYVWALGSGGMSPQTRVVITTLPAPAPPAGLRATATSTTLTLRWNAAAGATSYEVQRSGSSTARTVSSGRAYTFTGLTAGASYTLYVRSKNNNGHSAWVSVSGVTAPPQPSVPSIAATHNSLTLSWPSVRGATGYEVKRVGSSAIWTTTSTSYTFSRLSSNASYTLSVRATNAGGKSAWRSQTGTTLLPNPTGLSVSANTSSSLTLSWTLDSRAIWYRVKRGAGGTEQLLSSSRSSYTFSGLNANTSYTLYVRAVGTGGLTGWSSTSARTATSLTSCLTTTRLNTYSAWVSLDSHCANGGSASALWADLQAASVGVGCISHWNTSAGSWQRYQSGSGWSSFTIAYGAVLWLSSSACPRPSGAGGASGASGTSDDGSSSCTDAVKPSTGSTVVRVGGSACVVVSGGGAVQVSNGAHTLNLTLSTGRDWLVLSASDFPDSDAGALLFMDQNSGGWLALNPSNGGELTRYVPTSAADLPALLDAVVNSASTG